MPTALTTKENVVEEFSEENVALEFPVPIWPLHSFVITRL